MRRGIPAWLRRKPYWLAGNGRGTVKREPVEREPVQMSGELYDAMHAVVQASIDYANAYLDTSKAPGVWEIETHTARMTLFDRVAQLGEMGK